MSRAWAIPARSGSAGHTAGGIGFLVRKNGLTIDDLLAAEVVTANGEIVQASEQSEPDLFWAIRGGESNFGVATRLQLRLHEISRDRRRDADAAGHPGR